MAQFSPEFLDELRARVPLADVVGRRVKLTRRGREYVGLSPFQKEKTPSFTVVPDKGFFHCFSSGEHGDVIGWVMKMDGLSFPEAVEKLAEEAGLPLPRDTPEERVRSERRKGLQEALEAAADWFSARLFAKEGGETLSYLKRRGLSEETIKRFRLGYAPNERGALRRALNAAGFKDALLAEGGLIKLPDAERGEGAEREEASGRGGAARDYFFDRAIFPIADRRGGIIAFGGRAMGDSPAKYLNSPETPLFHKGRVLFNLDKARRAAHETGEVIVAEGYMDVVALCQAGFEAAVAPLGTALTEDQLAELWRLAPEPIICLDGDQAGQKAAFRAMERALPLLQPGKSLRFALLPQGEDPDSLLQSQGPGVLRGVLAAAKPLSELLWMRETQGKALDTPERRAGLRQSLEKAVREIQDNAVQEAYRQDVRRRFDAAYGRVYQQSGNWRRGRGKQAGGVQVMGLPAPGSRMPPGLLPRRNEQALLAAAINHPAILQDHLEDLTRIHLSSADLESLRAALTDLLAEQPDLDSDAIKGHLRQQGYSGLLDSLLSRNVYDLSTFARPSAPSDWVREGWRHGLELIRERQAREETVEATRQLAESMDEADLNRLESRKRLTREGEARCVDLDKYDPASGNG